ncbi:MAG: BON domain-containing protein [Pseudomonadota bacterium]
MTDFRNSHNPTLVQSRSFRFGLVAVIAGATLALAACGDKNQTAGEKVDAALARTEQAGANTMAKAKELGSEARDKIAASTASGESSMKQGASDAKNAVDDAAITAQVSAGLAKDADLSAIKINVDTKGGVVRLQGPAPTSAAKDRAEQIAKGVTGVSSVDNELEVKPM